MARDFTKNLSNYYSLGVNAIGPLIHGASAISVAMWANLDTIGAAGFDSDHLGVAINGSTAGVAIGVQGTITPKTLRVGGRSVSTDAFQVRDTITGYGTGTWQHIGGVLNFGADTITPYWNGVAENGGAVTFANTTYTNGTPTAADAIGTTATIPPTSTDRQMDGRLAHLAIWKADIGAAAFQRLAKGADPRTIRRDALVFYRRLSGGRLHDVEDVGALTAGAITGTVNPAADPPVFTTPRVRRRAKVSSAVVTARRLALLGVG